MVANDDGVANRVIVVVEVVAASGRKWRGADEKAGARGRARRTASIEREWNYLIDIRN